MCNTPTCNSLHVCQTQCLCCYQASESHTAFLVIFTATALALPFDVVVAPQLLNIACMHSLALECWLRASRRPPLCATTVLKGDLLMCKWSVL